MYSLPMNLHKHQLYLLEQHSESFNIWSAIIRINTEGKSLIMKLGPESLIITPPPFTRCPGSDWCAFNCCAFSLVRIQYTLLYNLQC